MFFTVYRTTNKINGKYYIGVHKTDTPMDGYLGSGKHLKRAVAKYGEDSFTKEILLSSDSPDAAFALEFELVEKHRSDPFCYNLRQGGSGGFDYINRTGLNGTYTLSPEARKRSVESHKKRYLEDEEYRLRAIRNLRQGALLIRPEVREASRQKAIAARRGGTHTAEVRQLISRNTTLHQLGKRWINKDGECKRIILEELSHWIELGWSRGKKKKIKLPKKVRLIDIAPEGTSWCSVHKEFLPIIQFHRDRLRLSGYKNCCIDCRRTKRGTKNPQKRKNFGPIAHLGERRWRLKNGMLNKEAENLA